jgi:Carboxypeptidase regulatory-like domain/TonB dependent receptor-like, beta-barrel
MRSRTLAALVAVLLLSWPLAAQEQRGSIEGVVKDTSGAVLPGVTVEARSGGSGVLSTVSDASGNYRFPSLLPGMYELTANLAGFRPAKVGDVEIKLGSIKKVDFGMQLSGVTEQVTVTAESPLVDVKQSGRSTNIRAEQVSLLPHGRDFTTLVTQAPGVNNEAKSNGVMIDGAAAAENRYVIDGIETTDLVGGLSGKNLLADFVEEVQIKSTGYSAEYGGATGGVINVQTKSGSNKFNGSLLSYYQGSNTTGANNPTLRAVFGDATRAEYHTFPEDKVTRFEPGVSLGGPVFRDKMWFFGAYQPANTTTKRHVDATTSGIASAVTHDTNQTSKVQYLSGNVTNQFGNKLRTRVAYNNSWQKDTGLLAATSGAEAATTDYSKGTKFPNWSMSGTADYTVTNNFLISGRAGRYFSNKEDFNVNNQVRFFFADNTTNIGQAGVPASEQHPAGYANIPSNNGIGKDEQTRNFMQVDATYFAHLAGAHQFKGGVQIDHRGNDVVNGNLQNVLNLRWGTSFGGIQGPFGYYEVVSSGPTSYQTGFATNGNVKSNVNGVFLQDQWTVSNRLTINGGIRTESENVPAYSTAEGITPNPIKFTWGQKVAPRLGFAYDIKGDGRTKAYGSWGVFYDIFKLNLPRGSFGGDKWISYYYTLDTPNFETLRDSAGCPPACPGTPITSIDFRAASTTPGVDVEQQGQFKPMRTQELSFGLEHQLNNVMATSIRFVHKQLDRAIDDIGDLGPNGEAYIIANPGEGLVSQFDISTGTSVFLPQEPGGVFPANAQLITMPKATRNYNSVEAALDKRFSNRWMFHGSYMWSRDAGNYSGLSSSDEPVAATGIGRDNPNNSRDFDYPSMTFNQKGEVIDGVFDTDRTHQVKAQVLYQFKFGTSVGLNEFLASGTPITRQVPVVTGSNYPIRYLGRNSEGRTPMFSQSDLFVAHSFRIAGTRTIQLSANVLNLFDQRVVTNRVSLVRRSGVIPNAPGYYQEAAFYAGQLDFDQLTAKAVAAGLMALNPQFGMDNLYQAPIVARFGVKFTF